MTGPELCKPERSGLTQPDICLPPDPEHPWLSWQQRNLVHECPSWLGPHVAPAAASAEFGVGALLELGWGPLTILGVSVLLGGDSGLLTLHSGPCSCYSSHLARLP